MMLAHIYGKKKEQVMRWERKETNHAKLMVKDVQRHTPTKAELDSIETVHIQMDRVNVQFSHEKTEELTFLWKTCFIRVNKVIYY